MEHGESPTECAIREVKEEIGYDITPYLNENEFIEIETHYGRYQRLYMVTGIDEDISAFTPQTFGEIEAVQWVSIENLFGLCFGNSKYRQVQHFAYLIKRWVAAKQANEELPESDREVHNSDNDSLGVGKRIEYIWKAMRYHFERGDLKKAASNYKKSIRTFNCPQ